MSTPGDETTETEELEPGVVGADQVEPDVVQAATTGRSKCRACEELIAKGTMRFGERLPNPFTETPSTYWFHLDCALLWRSDKVLAVLNEQASRDVAPELLASAKRAEQFPKLVRVARVERAPSGRARCRQCRELIEKGTLRFGLRIFEEGRFAPIGYVHLECQSGYFGAQVDSERLRRVAAALPTSDWPAAGLVSPT